MDWTPDRVSEERPILQFLAEYKYDEYQQFSPGMRFVESLALWLKQFDQVDRDAAYAFIRERLIFISSTEMRYLISIAYRDYLRPQLINQVAADLGQPPYLIGRVIKDPAFKVAQRRCLFLGLSDGAKTDIFRRSNLDLRHDQVLANYDFSLGKATDLLKKLQQALKQLSPDQSYEPTFQDVYLIDDFTGSGYSFIRKNPDTGEVKGKIRQFLDRVADLPPESKLLSDDAGIHLVFYVATEQARKYIQEQAAEYFGERRYSIHVIQLIASTNRVRQGHAVDAKMIGLANQARFYDSIIEDSSMQVGGTDGRMGFASCALPVVLSHNTPNNSIFLLWANPDETKVRGLFPRFSRHRKDV